MAKEITDANFNKEVLQSQGVVMVDFWATWCGPCRMLAPVYEKMSQKYPQIKFCKLNTDDNQEKSAEMGITGIPCVIVFKNGQETERIIGFKPEPEFEKIVKKYV